MQIERIDEMRLCPADEGQIANLLGAAFDSDFGGRSFCQQRPHLRLVTRQDDRIVGHMGIDLRDIRMGDTAVTVAGLGDVATDAACRGQGIASALLRAAIAEVKQSPAQFFILFGDAPLYAGNGFQAMTNTIRFISLLHNRTHAIYEQPSDGLMVLPLDNLAWDPDALIDLVGHPI
ncbi:GNAT family N-acetyltransferase [Loktanella agnita]